MRGEMLFDEIVNTVSKYAVAGEKLMPDGARLIFPLPEIGIDAWMHAIFPPLAQEGIQEIEIAFNVTLPKAFKELLAKANGLMLFSYYLEIWGVRGPLSRQREKAWRPFDVFEHNSIHLRPEGTPENVFFFGSTNEGRDWCFFEFNLNGYRVGKTIKNTFIPEYYRDDFESWLLKEIRSLDSLFVSKHLLK